MSQYTTLERQDYIEPVAEVGSKGVPNESSRVMPHEWIKLKRKLPTRFHNLCDLGRKSMIEIKKLKRQIKPAMRSEQGFQSWGQFTDLRPRIERILTFCHECLSKGSEESGESLQKLSERTLLTESEEFSNAGTTETRPIAISFYLANFKSFLTGCVYDTLQEIKDRVKEDMSRDQLDTEFAGVLKKKVVMYGTSKLTEEEEFEGGGFE